VVTADNSIKSLNRPLTPCTSKRRKTIFECAICLLKSTSDGMVGCNSCMIHFHVTCVDLGIKNGTIVQGDCEIYCSRCATENQKDEYEGSQETNALMNMKKRRKSRNVESKNLHLRLEEIGKVETEDSQNFESILFYECDQCTKLFISKLNLEKHYKIHGTTGAGMDLNLNLTSHYCPEKVFCLNKSDLSCPVCLKKFEQKIDQVIHIASHAEENQMSVETQQEPNRKTAKLETPENCSRTRRKLLKCTWCDKVFHKSSDELIEHMGIHTGEKSIQCKYCTKYYRFSSSLSRHVRREHPSFHGIRKTNKVMSSESAVLDTK